MLRLLQLLFLGHAHNWKIIEQNSLTVHRHPSDGGGEYQGQRYVLQCQGCGNIKQRDIT